MAWTDLVKLLAGKGIPQSWLDGVVDNFAHLKGQLGTLAVGLANGSFEDDLDANGIPDNWLLSTFSGGSYALSSDAHDGARSLKLTATAGGGYAQALSEGYLLCAAGQRIELPFALKASAAGVRVRAQLLWYDAGLSGLGTATVYDSTANPVSWERRQGPGQTAVAPTSARYYRVQFIVGESGGSVAADVYWDAVAPRVYRGPVWLSPAVDMGAAGTKTLVAGTHHAAGERPTAAWIRWLASPDGGAAPAATFTGNGVLVYSSAGNDAGAHGDQVCVPLNGSLQYTCTIGGSSIEHYLVGYEV